MMLVNEEIIGELYAAAEGQGLDVERFVSFFCEEGYMYDIPSVIKFRGQAIGESIGAFASAFPDVHRELTSIYVAENVVDVELATRGTNKGELALSSGTLAPTGTCSDYFYEYGYRPTIVILSKSGSLKMVIGNDIHDVQR